MTSHSYMLTSMEDCCLTLCRVFSGEQGWEDGGGGGEPETGDG